MTWRTHIFLNYCLQFCFIKSVNLCVPPLLSDYSKKYSYLLNCIRCGTPCITGLKLLPDSSGPHALLNTLALSATSLLNAVSDQAHLSVLYALMVILISTIFASSFLLNDTILFTYFCTSLFLFKWHNMVYLFLYIFLCF